MGGRCIAIAATLTILLPITARADELADMQTMLSEQARQIRALQDEVRKLHDERAASGPGGELTMNDVDERIQAFETHPTSQLFISGYGAAGYIHPEGEDGWSNMLVVPIFHYKLGDRLHMNAEVELDMRGHETTVGIEYAQIDFLLNDYVTLTAGKFLMPFNTFSERTHPSWINKLPSMPPIYGSHESGGGVVPVLSDTGVQLRGGFRLPWSIDERGSRINYALYVTNGPRMEPESEEDHRFEELAEFLESEGAIPDAHDLLDAVGIEDHHGTELEFGENLSDNNNNKAVGGRLGFLPIPSLELGGSWMSGRFDDAEDLDFRMHGMDFLYTRGPWDFRGEFLNLSHDNEGGGTTRTHGFYVQAAVRLRDFASRLGQNGILDQTELVLRYGELDDVTKLRQTTFGINYWITPSAPLKIAYTRNDEDRNEVDNDRFEIQLALGF
jgi:hypothetical protein